MRCLLSSLLAVGLLVSVSCHVGRQEFLPPNRCLAGQGCFPSRQMLREFSATLQGKLYFPSSPEYAGLVNNVNNRQTRHPAMIVLAASVSDVQKAMSFARKNQLMVTSTSGDNDPSGRDSFDGSLNINLSNMKSVTALNVNTTRSEYGEITAQTGATWEEVYVEAQKFQRDVVAPNTIKASVGSSVGDGGIGPLVRIYGLVSDNLLEAQVVMADGSLVTVSEYKVLQDFGDSLVVQSFDRALLASIKAGGVGPWGVVVSYTFKMKQAPAGITRVRLQYNLWQDGSYIGASVMETVLAGLVGMPLKWGGYLYVSGMTSTTTANTKGGLVVNLMYYGTYREDSDYDWVDSIFNINTTALVTSKTVNETSVLVFEQNQPSILKRQTGSFRYYGFNKLFQRADPPMQDESAKLTEALLFALNSPTIESTYFCNGQILGGAVENGPQLPQLDLVNPLLRSSYMSFSCQLVYPGRGLDDSFYVDHVFDFINLLKPFGTGMDAFWAQEDIPDWKSQIYGAAYGKLIETKLKYDVDNYIWCPNCVGSDYRVKACNQPMSDPTGLREYGNMLGGYISSKRYQAAKQKEASQEHRARLVYIHQMFMGGPQ